MNTAGRACLGALIGAIITLIIHPASRPFMLAASTEIPPAKVKACLDHDTDAPPVPHDTAGASLWMELAANRIITHHPLREGELQTMLQIADRASEVESENAYWPQMKAVLLSWAGKPQPAYEAWRRASRSTFWNDYQTERLVTAQSRLAKLTGTDQAWQYAYVYYERSEIPALLIERYARTLLSQAGFDSRQDIETRYVTLVNGEMLRTGAKSLAVATHGANMVDLVGYPRDLLPESTPKRLWVGQNTLLNNMAKMGMADSTARARLIFGNNEGWRALTPDDASEEMSLLGLSSTFSAGIVGACALSAFVGLLVWSIGWLASRYLGRAPRFTYWHVVPILVVLALIAGWLTHDVWAGFVGAISGGFLLVGPKQARRARPEDIGPLFSFLIVILSLQCGLAVAVFAIFKTTPAKALLPQLNIPIDFYSTPLIPGLASIFMAIGVIAAPIWATVQKLGTPHVFTLALRKLGVYLAYGSLAAGIVLGPISVYADRRLEQTLRKMVGNEPIYYLITR